MQRNIEGKKRKEDALCQRMFSEVFAGLSYDAGITGEISQTLALSQKIKHQKRRDLHQEWTTDVYDKITSRIQAAVDARDIQDVERRLRHNYQDYITTANTKLAVFRDVIIEADYNPLKYRSQNIRYKEHDVMDPVKRDMLRSKRDAARVRAHHHCYRFSRNIA